PNALFNEATIEHFIEEDIFFEIIHPKELQYTYRLHKARDFGSSFVNPPILWCSTSCSRSTRMLFISI
ncbi:PRADC1-like protein, partial [Armadillidium nasatum]